MMVMQMEQQIKTDEQKMIEYECKQHKLPVKYFQVEISAIESLLCEQCYNEKQQKKNIKVLLFEMIYHEILQEISTLPLQHLLSKCSSLIVQVKNACNEQNLFTLKTDIIDRLTKNLSKSFEILNRISMMKDKISDKIWSSYFVKAIQNKTAITQAMCQLSEAEKEIEQIKQGYFSYRKEFAVTSAFLLQNNLLLIQESTGNIYIYDSNKLTLLYEPVRDQSTKKFSKAVSAFIISKKKFGVIHENANLTIYKKTFYNKLTILKKIQLKIVPVNIQISNNFLRLNYNLFQIIINARNFKLLESNNKCQNLLRMNHEQFFEMFTELQNTNKEIPYRDVFKEKTDMAVYQLHTNRKCLSCQQWNCKQPKKSMLKYTNDENQLVKIQKYGVRL